MRDPDCVRDGEAVCDDDGGAGVLPCTMMPPMNLAVPGPPVSHDVEAHDDATDDVPTPNAPTDERPHVSTARKPGWGEWGWP